MTRATSDVTGSESSGEAGEMHPHLSVWDGVSIIIGIVVGSSIFKTPSIIFANVDGPWAMFGAWTLGGLLTLVGAFCYAELATTYPYTGGDYAYLKHAYGPWTAYLFGWAQLAAVLTGSIGAMAYVFADYAVNLFGDSVPTAGWAAGSVLVLAVANILGAHVGKTVQNGLTILKLVGLAAIVLAGLLARGDGPVHEPSPMSGPGFGLAMIFVLYGYGGWNDAAFVASEVTDRHRNMPRVLIFGSLAVLAIYLLVNLGYLWGLGFEGVRKSGAPAADVMQSAFGAFGGKAMSVLVMISALGAVNGLLFTGSRISASLGADHPVFAFLKRWDPRLRTPVWAIASSAVVSIAMIGLVGTARGRDSLDAALGAVGLPGLPWDKYFGGFDTLFAGTAPIFWAFFLLTGVAVFVLRWKNPDRPRPYSVPFYPFSPLLFCLTSAYMLYKSLDYAQLIVLIGIVPVAVGVPLYWIGRRRRN